MGQIIEFNNKGLQHTIEKNSRIVNLLIVNYIVNFERQYEKELLECPIPP